MSNERLKNTRERFFSVIKDTSVNTEMLQGLLSPPIFEPNKDLGSAQEKDSIDWTAKYFDEQLIRAESNFSRERVEHLLEIREHLRKNKIQHFAPTSPPKKDKTGTTALGYVPPENLEMFIKEGDLLTIRTALRMELNNNSLTTKDLSESFKWVEHQVKEKLKESLVEEYVEKAFARAIDENEEHWSSSYYDTQVVYLKTNFSSKRFHHLIEVRRSLRRQNKEGFIAPEPWATIEAPTANEAKKEEVEAPTAVLNRAMLIGGSIALLAILLITLIWLSDDSK